MKTPAIIAAVFAVVIDSVIGVPVDAAVGSGIVQRTAPPGIQMWSQAEYTGHFVHYTAPQIAYGQCGRFYTDTRPVPRLMALARG